MTVRSFVRPMMAMFALAVGGTAALLGATQAQARVVVGIGVGPFWGYPYYPYPYAYPYPYYPAPPVVYVPGDPGYEAPPQAASATWYYCNSPAGYYPYVQQCNGPWRPVPATPQQ